MWRQYIKWGQPQYKPEWPNDLEVENKLNITDETKFLQTEANVMMFKKMMLELDPITFDSLDTDYLQKLHKHLYSDLFESAGELRSSEWNNPQIQKALDVPEALEELLQDLEDSAYFINQDELYVFESIAYATRDLYRIMPFEVGNAHLCGCFAGLLTRINGYEIDFNKLDKHTLEQGGQHFVSMLENALRYGSEPMSLDDQRAYIEKISPEGILKVFDRLEKAGKLKDRSKISLDLKISKAQTFGTPEVAASKGQSFGKFK